MPEISEIDYKLGQDNVRFLGLDIHNPVFVVSSLTIIAFVAGVLAFRAEAAVAFEALRAWLISTFDWVLMGTGNLFVLFCLLLLVTPPGRVRLGGADARPDYSRTAWFAMLFAAGTGIGLMFFGVAEPVEHFLQPPLGLDAGDTAAAARLGMASAIYHWGVHGWAMYAVVAVAIAFASFIGLVLVAVFFVTSSDSGSLVIDTITAGGKLDAPVVQRVFWCVFEGLIAIALLLGGGLVAAQAATLATALPFALVLVAMCYSAWKGLRASTAGGVR